MTDVYKFVFFWFLRILLIYGVIAFVSAIPLYILYSLALVSIAKQRNHPSPYLAWIPFYNLYLTGYFALYNKVYGIVMTSLIGAYLLFMRFAPVDINPWIRTFMAVVMVAFFIMFILSIANVYRQQSGKWVIMLVFSLLSLGFLIPVFLFAVRKKPNRFE